MNAAEDFCKDIEFMDFLDMAAPSWKDNNRSIIIAMYISWCHGVEHGNVESEETMTTSLLENTPEYDEAAKRCDCSHGYLESQINPRLFSLLLEIKDDTKLSLGSWICPHRVRWRYLFSSSSGKQELSFHSRRLNLDNIDLQRSTKIINAAALDLSDGLKQQ
jgi:hypothetical protein